MNGSKKPVLVSLGCYNEISHSGGGLNNRHLFLTVLEAGKSKIKVPADSVPDGGSLPCFQKATCSCVLMWPFLGAHGGTESSAVSSFFFFNFIYFWLHWVFVAVCRLPLVAVSEGYSLLWCAGFSLRWLLLLQSTGSRHAGFSSCGSWALEHRLSSCGARA